MNMIPSATPKVSVIIPTYNRADLLPRAVNSVLSQDFRDYEIIIVDDCSTDATQEVIQGFADSRIRSMRHERNRRQSAAINTGIAHARGEYVAFLDDDDEWLSMKLSGQLAAFDKSPSNVGLAYCWLEVVDDSTGNVVSVTGSAMQGDVFDDALALNVPAQTSVLMARSSVAREVGGYTENLARYTDADFICRVAQRYHVVVFADVAARGYFGHRHEQIGHLTSQTLSAAVGFLTMHMTRFSTELDERPRARATLLRRLASVEMMRGNRRAALVALLSAFRLDPAGVSRALLRNRRLAAKTLTYSSKDGRR